MVNKEEYFHSKENDLKSIINKSRLKNYSIQIFAKKLGAEFKDNYEEEFLWNQALYLSSRGSFLLEEDPKNEIGIESLRFAAEIYENLYYVSDEYDRDYCSVLSSLCYDIAGYQSNAQCIINKLNNNSHYYSLKENDDILTHYENRMLKHVQLFLQKKIFLLSADIENESFEISKNLSFHYNKLFLTYWNGIKNLCEFIKEGDADNFYQDLDLAYNKTLSTNNVLLSHLLYLFNVRISLFKKRNIWDVMSLEEKTSDPNWNKYLKLLSSDLYKNNNTISQIEERNSIFEFWRSQLEAISKGILSENKNHVIRMPTSAGKTLIAELKIIDSLFKNPGSKCIYIAPFRALSTEIKETLSSRIEKLGFVVSNAIGGYEVDDFESFWIQTSDVLVTTPEKLDLIYRNTPEFFNNISLVIIDEGHVIGEQNKRASLLEFLIMKLRRKLKENTNFLFISAVMTTENAKQISEWLAGDSENVISSPKVYSSSSEKEWEPTRKLIGYYKWFFDDSGCIVYPGKKIERTPAFLPKIVKQKTYHFIHPSTKRKRSRRFPDHHNKKDEKGNVYKVFTKTDTAVKLAYELIEDGSVLIFAAKTSDVKNIAKSFIDKLIFYKDNNHESNIKEEFSYREDLESIEISEKWLGENNLLTKCLKRGVGIHCGPLPEPVRKSIEKDFRNNKLSMLICTNTIGHGLNFPIKTAIIYSVDINPIENAKISVRDFWNIVGRAGRAGKETEGQIIFLNFHQRDHNIFKEYTNKDNAEDLESVLFVLLRDLIKKRITEKTFNENLEYFIEPSFLNMLLEETFDTINEEVVENILGYSLFNIQSESYDKTPIINSMKRIGQNFYMKVEEPELRNIYSKTGFHTFSCLEISEKIKDKIELFKIIIEKDDYQEFIKNALPLLFPILEMNDDNIDKSIIIDFKDQLIEFTLKWVNGSNINELTEFWNNIFQKTYFEKKMHLFINNFIEYKYSWCVSAFLEILIYHLKEKYGKSLTLNKNLPPNIKNLPSFLKYGLNNPVACMAKNIGINNRETSLIIAGLYPENITFLDFISDFKELDQNKIDNLELSIFEQKNIFNSIQELNYEKITLEVIFSSEYNVKGIPYENYRKKLSNYLTVGDYLYLIRDYENVHDIYAIKLMFKDNELGFIPRKIAKYLAIEIDLDEKQFIAEIIHKRKIKDYSKIKIRIFVSNNIL